ncbi:MAG TPA: ABC transporter permease subunit [Euzebya sp.]|nr:ABC transporter permease subunit [Euzebya sp.]
MSAQMPALRSEENPPLYRDVRFLRWAGQIAVLVVVIGAVYWLYGNVVTNLRSSGLPTGFDFLDRRFGAAIPGIEDSANFSVTRAFGAGYLNTVRVILVGIPACTILGIFIGIARLSQNAAVRTFGMLYVELFRNIPVLLWIFIGYFVLGLGNLPGIVDEVTPLNAFVVSNRGIGIPWFNPSSSVGTFVAFVGLAMVVAVLVSAYRGRVNAKTGEPARGGLYATIAFLAVLVIGHFAAGNALSLDAPVIQGRLIAGGLTMDIPYAFLTAALVLYTASHVAEIVRGAIQSIHKGQGEAANAIALSTFQRYRFVILPQAFRVMIPPLANQYLNITKNSSLAVAVSYVEITAIFGRIVNNATPAVQGLVVLMALYLSFSLSISAVANFINRRLALETR